MSLWVTEMTPQGRVGCPRMGFESLPQLGSGQPFMTQLMQRAVRRGGRRVSRSLQRRAPCSEEGRDRYIEDKLTDTISANIAPTPQDALPCVFLSAVAGGGGCSAPPQAERGTSANRTRRVHGSTPGPGEEEEDVPSKQATLERKINK